MVTDSLLIQGGVRLSGEVAVSGSKNSALALLVATLLTDEPCRLRNVPDLEDVHTLVALLKLLGKRVLMRGDAMEIHSGATKLEGVAPYRLVHRMRASCLVMGPLLVRLRRARVAHPGGCAIGARPIDIHLRGFQSLGASVAILKGDVVLKAPRGLAGKRIRLSFPSVGATENIMMAAVLAKGTTQIENAAREPEVSDLAGFLNGMGAHVLGAGTQTLIIKGSRALSGCDETVIPDRIEAGTFLLAAAATRGRLQVRGARAEHLGALLEKLSASGCRLRTSSSGIEIDGSAVSPIDIETRPYPGFPTDLQALWMVLMCTARGKSVITENIFENRFSAAGDLRRMGADIRIQGRSAAVQGGISLSGAQVEAGDLRASAALCLAGLSARGQTRLLGLTHLFRGYERFVSKMRGLGARVILQRYRNEKH